MQINSDFVLKPLGNIMPYFVITEGIKMSNYREIEQNINMTELKVQPKIQDVVDRLFGLRDSLQLLNTELKEKYNSVLRSDVPKVLLSVDSIESNHSKLYGQLDSIAYDIENTIKIMRENLLHNSDL